MGNFYTAYAKPEITPAMDSQPTFDPLEGFPSGRPKRGI